MLLYASQLIFCTLYAYDSEKRPLYAKQLTPLTPSFNGIRSFRQRLVGQRLRSIRQRPKSFRQRLTGQFANVSYPVQTKKKLVIDVWNPSVKKFYLTGFRSICMFFAL